MSEPCYYGFPVFGEPAVKVAQDGGGEVTTAEARSFETDDANRGARARVHAADVPARRRARAPASRPASTRCRPTATSCSTGLPGHDRVLLCVGAGHAFKFATQLGRILAELTLAGATAHDISLFRADRGVLGDPGAERTWNV